MRALITGAASGIGRDMARYLNSKGYDLIIVDKDKNKLKELNNELTGNNVVIVRDLSINKNCVKLYRETRNYNIDILVNNAGFGDIGLFEKTDLNTDLSMINVNVCAMHILTKLFLADFKKNNRGYILNVASVAAFNPGPLMATYYATKSYIFNMTLAISEELRQNKSNVKISVLCPGPTKTNFNNVAGCEFKIKSVTSQFVAHYGIDKMLEGKKIIIPTLMMKLNYIFSKILPKSLILKIFYNIQYSKK